ncbi:ParA family protein [Deinococcus sp. HMF7604]|uniref:ParA family protein n=1 Tax=Deinococcus betulae TaxID=2873312 RepID=UPI001CCDDDF2|nr:ParA family protein [Deinococcus betulae]MBZ9750720.1 ParA family protein [Deinococcus betulae]
MAVAVAVVNLKGGVGKTAISVNFAAYCGINGLRTLLIDLDPQTNATLSCIDVATWQNHATNKGTVADLFGLRKLASAQGRSKIASEVVMKSVFPLVDLIPSHLDLFTMDLEMSGATAREFKIQKAVREIEDNYDVIVCDCPPNLTIPTQNALVLCSKYVVPVSPDYLSGLGVGLLLGRIAEFKDDAQLNIDLAGIVISRVGRPAQHREETVASLRATFGGDILTNQISERVAVSESASKSRSIYDSSDATAIAEFEAVSLELRGKLGI